MDDMVELHYRDARSDKVYKVWLEQDPVTSAYRVKFAYGRRGSALKEGEKLQTVNEHVARNKMAALVREKEAKGYTIVGTGSGVKASTVAAEVSKCPIMPQLLNAIEEAELESKIMSESWAMQPKFDGRRLIIELDTDGKVYGYNRRGLWVPVNEEVADTLRELPIRAGRMVFDCEDMGGWVAIFDMMVYKGRDITGERFQTRWYQLHGLFEDAGLLQDTGCVVLAETSVNPAVKRAMLDKIDRAGAEGVVLRDTNAPYKPGRPNSGGDALKFKLVEDATFEVGSGLRTGRRSVSLLVYDSLGKPVDVGYVTIPTNQKIPEPGMFVDVRYLYAYPGGSLFQPVFLRTRTDVTAEDVARLTSLKLKPTDAAPAAEPVQSMAGCW